MTKEIAMLVIFVLTVLTSFPRPGGGTGGRFKLKSQELWKVDLKMGSNGTFVSDIRTTGGGNVKMSRMMTGGGGGMNCYYCNIFIGGRQGQSGPGGQENEPVVGTGDGSSSEADQPKSALIRCKLSSGDGPSNTRTNHCGGNQGYSCYTCGGHRYCASEIYSSAFKGFQKCCKAKSGSTVRKPAGAC